MNREAASDFSGPGTGPRLRSQRSNRAIFTRAGHPVKISNSIWRIPYPSGSMALYWDKLPCIGIEIRNANEAYLIYLIANSSKGEIKNNWTSIKQITALPSVSKAGLRGVEIPLQFFTEFEAELPKHEKYRLHFARKWYTWCSDAGFALFSPEVAFYLEQRVIGGNEKGNAVRSADPEKGPLQDAEVKALGNALRAARMTAVIDLQEEAAVWLALAFGSNPEPIALLREEDFWSLEDSDEDAPIYLLNIPRHKKGDAAPRTQFRERRLNPEIGEIVQALISRNRVESPVGNDVSDGRPLFRRTGPRKDLPVDGLGSDYRYHHTSQELASLVCGAVAQLGVISPRTGRPLKITMRRLRYTFATRLVNEGASRQVVAQLLDHTDLQNVGVYFDAKSDIVERLDAAGALELGPLAQAFLGKLVRSEQEAVRGDRPSSRVYHRDRTRDQLDALGTCGSFSFCGLTAPIACYTCVRFQPWMDAPHDKALTALLAERNRRQEAGLGASMIEIFDMTILAVADVIRRIEVMRGRGSNAC